MRLCAFLTYHRAGFTEATNKGHPVDVSTIPESIRYLLECQHIVEGPLSRDAALAEAKAILAQYR
jgi:hypothetical protein